MPSSIVRSTDRFRAYIAFSTVNSASMLTVGFSVSLSRERPGEKQPMLGSCCAFAQAASSVIISAKMAQILYFILSS